MSGALVAGLVAGIGVALPVGPIGTYLFSLGARERLLTAVAAALGVASTDGLFAALAALGGVPLQTALRRVADPLTWASVAALLLLALRTLVVAVRGYHGSPEPGTTSIPRLRPLRAYASLVALTALNPATIAYFSALVLGDQSETIGRGAPAASLFAAGALIASATWQLTLSGGGVALGRVVTGRRGRLVIAAVSASIMVLLAGRLLAS